MTLFVVKLILSPLLIAAATLAARRWGESVGGWIVGLPLTSGPVSFFLALEQGNGFAAHAAQSGLLGAVGVAVFCLVYARRSSRLAWPATSLWALLCYGVAVYAFSFLHWPLPLVFVMTLLLLRGVLLLIKLPRDAGLHPPPPRWDLPLRMCVATVMVLALTTGAERLGAEWSGLLAPFPVFTLIMVGFVHAQSGCAAVCRLLRGVVVGCFAATAFFGVVALMLPGFAVGWTYAVAVGAALVINAGTFTMLGARGTGAADFRGR